MQESLLPFLAICGEFSTPVMVNLTSGQIVISDEVTLPDGTYTLHVTTAEDVDTAISGSFEVADGNVVQGSVKLDLVPEEVEDIIHIMLNLSALFGQPVSPKLTSAERNAQTLDRFQFCLDVANGKLAIREDDGLVEGYEHYGPVSKTDARRNFLENMTRYDNEGHWYAANGLLEAPQYVLSHRGYKDVEQLQAEVDRLKFFFEQRLILLAEDAAAAEASANATPTDDKSDATQPPPAPISEEGTSPA